LERNVLASQLSIDNFQRQHTGRMSVDTELKAGLILEDLSRQLSDAQVDYHYRSGQHEFIIRRDGSTYRVAFPERVLLEHPIRVLEKAVPKIVKRLLAPDSPASLDINDATPWYCQTSV
jgi:hypothetical protein